MTVTIPRAGDTRTPSDLPAKHYDAEWMSVADQASLRHWLEHDRQIEWRTERFKLFGKSVQVPRSLCWFGDVGLNYRYTGIDHFAAGWPDALLAVREHVISTAGVPFNFVLINRYLDGSQYMGWHRDNERGVQPEIASLSLGAVRRFKIKEEENGGSVQTYDLASGSLLVFDGRQKHMLCKTRRPCGCRFNLTFRCVISADD